MNEPTKPAAGDADPDRIHEIAFDPEATWSYILTRIRAIGAIDRLPLLTGFPDWAILRAFRDLPAADIRLLAINTGADTAHNGLSLHGDKINAWLVADNNELATAVNAFIRTSGHGIIYPPLTGLTYLSDKQGSSSEVWESEPGGIIALAAHPSMLARAADLRRRCTGLGLQPAILRIWHAFPVPRQELETICSAYDALAILDQPESPMTQCLMDWQTTSGTRIPAVLLAPDMSDDMMIDKIFATSIQGGRFKDPR